MKSMRLWKLPVLAMATLTIVMGCGGGNSSSPTVQDPRGETGGVITELPSAADIVANCSIKNTSASYIAQMQISVQRGFSSPENYNVTRYWRDYSQESANVDQKNMYFVTNQDGSPGTNRLVEVSRPSAVGSIAKEWVFLPVLQKTRVFDWDTNSGETVWFNFVLFPRALGSTNYRVLSAEQHDGLTTFVIEGRAETNSIFPRFTWQYDQSGQDNCYPAVVEYFDNTDQLGRRVKYDWALTNGEKALQSIVVENNPGTPERQEIWSYKMLDIQTEPALTDGYFYPEAIASPSFPGPRPTISGDLNLDLAKRSGCLACHAVDKKIVGPAWNDVAARYRSVAGARDALVNKVKAGGKGNWTDVTGGVPMPPYSPRVSDADIVALVDGILSLTSSQGSAPLPIPKPSPSVQVLPDLPAGTVVDLDLNLANASGCLACHSVDKKIVGPAWNNVAARYRSVAGARDALVNKVKAGGKGNWTEVTGGVPMPPYSPRVADVDIVALVDGILSLGNPTAPVLDVSVGLKQLHFTWSTGTSGETFRLLANPDGHSGFNIVIDNIAGTSAVVDVAVHRLDWANASYMLEACNMIGCRRSQVVTVQDKVLAAIGYFKASNTDAFDGFGIAVAMSGDGRTLAVGASDEDSNATGINGDARNNALSNSGAVYVYKKTDAAWQFHSYIKPTYSSAGSQFGISLALNHDGSVLAVGVPGDSSVGAGIDNYIDNPLAPEIASGAVYLYARTAESWIQQTYIKASNAQAGDLFGFVIALSADGSVLAVGAPFERSLSGGMNADQANNSGADVGAAYVFARTAGGWQQQAYIKASHPDSNDEFGYSLALSYDGNTLAVGSWGESSDATTINGNASDNSAPAAGAAYVFVHDEAGWRQQAYVKAPNGESQDWFGGKLALAGSGDLLAVGAPGEDAARGDDPTNNAAPNAGAVFLYARGAAGWELSAYLKASNADSNDGFGSALALSGDGKMLVVGAFQEDGAALAIGGDALDNSAVDSGAAYVFTLQDSAWKQTAYIKASNSGANDSFGGIDYQSLAVSADGNALAIGAKREDSAATNIGGKQSDNSSENAGAVYLY